MASSRPNGFVAGNRKRKQGGIVSIVSDLSLWQEVLLAGLAFLSLLYIFYFKIWVALAAGSDLLFATALGAAVAAIAVPALFEHVSIALVARSPLPAALATADEKVAALESLPSELIDRALTKLGYEPEPEDMPQPTAGPGPFEARIRPSVEALIAVVLRATGFFGGTLLLLLALAMRSSTSTARTMQALSLRIEALEQAAAPR